MEADKDKYKKPKSGERDSLGKYMGAGMQIVSPVILGVFIGMWLDKHFGNNNSFYTIVLSSIMIVVALYLFVRQFLKP